MANAGGEGQRWVETARESVTPIVPDITRLCVTVLRWRDERNVRPRSGGLGHPAELFGR